MKAFIFLCAFLMWHGISQADNLSVSSPDGYVKIDFAADHLKPNTDAPAYQVSYHGKPLLLPSLMGFEIAGQPILTTAFKIISSGITSHSGTWKPLYGENNEHPDNFNT